MLRVSVCSPDNMKPGPWDTENCRDTSRERALCLRFKSRCDPERCMAALESSTSYLATGAHSTKSWRDRFNVYLDICVTGFLKGNWMNNRAREDISCGKMLDGMILNVRWMLAPSRLRFRQRLDTYNAAVDLGTGLLPSSLSPYNHYLLLRSWTLRVPKGTLLHNSQPKNTVLAQFNAPQDAEAGFDQKTMGDSLDLLEILWVLDPQTRLSPPPQAPPILQGLQWPVDQLHADLYWTTRRASNEKTEQGMPGLCGRLRRVRRAPATGPYGGTLYAWEFGTHDRLTQRELDDRLVIVRRQNLELANGHLKDITDRIQQATEENQLKALKRELKNWWTLMRNGPAWLPENQAELEWNLQEARSECENKFKLLSGRPFTPVPPFDPDAPGSDKSGIFSHWQRDSLTPDPGDRGRSLGRENEQAGWSK